MNWSAVLFDFDYTLGDATEAIVTGFQYAFGQMGRPIPEREAVRLTVGHRLEDSYTLLTGDGDPARQAEFRRLYKQKADPLQVPATRLLPGALELLEALNAQGIPAGVVSTKGSAVLRAVLMAQGADHLVASITGGDQVKAPKPDPEGLLGAIQALGLTPEQVLFCGDTVIDAETAQRAGTAFCAVLNGTTGAAAFDPFPHAHIAPDLWDLKVWLGL